MNIVHAAVAGSLESSDVMVSIEPAAQNTVTINLNSSVEKQFGAQIMKVIKTTLNRLNVQGVSLEVTDKGALDCVIEARVETAVYRAADAKKFDWGEY
ncbi:MAG: citrate lyase acyl carrier protein [Sporolactobacillus sp.]